ncbi:hypothetical protein BDM02DRAFT_3192174 [Thelephora ganbajun]|uniref:Uncharacterized protein n=1 Tax=Thelephora ganbajun TaxID=370292 RepID=A0ACB6Z155_THEGA|nr:hypothetical protein BDM02DRAFT_3192174 [Thelephora ganbajun]
MTLENNHTFISPHNQHVSYINIKPHLKDSKPDIDAYGFNYPSMALLINAITSQEDNEFPCHQYVNGCLFNNIIWQQAIGVLKN